MPARYVKIMRWFVVFVLCAALIWLWRSGILSGLNLATLKTKQMELSGWTSAHPWYAAGILLLAYVFIAMAPLPGAALLTIGAGALFGLWRGTLLVSFTSTIGATIAMLASRFVLGDSLRARYGDRLKAFDQGIAKDGATYLLSLRLVPAVPFFVVNLLAGLTAIRTGVFYVVSQLGMLPATAVYVYAGTQLAHINSLREVVSPRLIGALVALGLLPLVLRGISGWLATRKIYRGHRRPKKFDYNLIVIGGGSAGLVSSYIAAAVKARVLLIEKHAMGGDCLNTGCVPSKALIRSAKLLHEARQSKKYGVAELAATFSFSTIMQRVQSVIAKVAPHDSVERYQGLGVEVISGEARIVSPWEVAVLGQKKSARSIIIATGARPLVPTIPGLSDVEFLTSDSLWALRELPARLLVLGGGPIGCELSQCFARLGSSVTLVEMAPRLLPREDADAAQFVEEQFRTEGIAVATNHKALRVEKVGADGVLICEYQGREVRFVFDKILLALGRKANVDGFGLQELGVRLSPRGTLEADAMMRTNFPNILVCGDVTGPFQFTHVAAHQAWFASVNALLAPFWNFKVDYRVIPWATFTDPEVARVGLSEDEAKLQGIEVEVTKYGIDDLDRAIADSSDHGFVKVLTAPGKDKILGATIVGDRAGDLLSEFVLAMKHGIGLNKILGTIHTYPTMAEANKYAAGVWKRAHAPQTALRWAQRFFRWRRGG
jgi:pyruvate/2-oxoglutarate dehydrogenase complex dihydrolipoamide dehydrogenase (E3) component/uncharacterized membrane protein YdjX (TVP38/TMEM64 family)